MIMFSVDDGSELDKKSIELLDKYGLRATFYIPIESYGFEHLDLYKNHAIGAHTWSHPSDLKMCSAFGLNVEITAATIQLRKVSEQDVTSFCPPRGRYDDRVLELIRRCGFKDMRTTTNGLVQKDTDAFRKPGLHCYQRSEYNGRDWLSYIKDRLVEDYLEAQVWWHSWEIEKYNEWEKLDNLLAFCNGLG